MKPTNCAICGNLTSNQDSGDTYPLCKSCSKLEKLKGHLARKEHSIKNAPSDAKIKIERNIIKLRRKIERLENAKTK